MYANGELQLPPRVMPIFSDVGLTQMMSREVIYSAYVNSRVVWDRGDDKMNFPKLLADTLKYREA